MKSKKILFPALILGTLLSLSACEFSFGTGLFGTGTNGHTHQTTPVVPTTPNASTTPVVPTTPNASTTPVVPTTPNVTTTPVVPTTPNASTTPVVPTTPNVTTTPVVPTTSNVTTTPVVPTTPNVTTTPVVPTTTLPLTTIVPTLPVTTTTPVVPTTPIVSTPNTTTSSPSKEIVDDLVYDEFQMHFLTLGNEWTGDCTYIKAGDIDILIDAGSRQNSADDISNYIDNYCTDKKLEYVISTHAHTDHISGFVGNKSNSKYNGIFYEYKVDTIIEFALTDQSETTASGAASLYGNYVIARDNAVSNGATLYKANQLFGDLKLHSNYFDLGNDMSFTVLYNYYYFNSASSTEGEENNYSVCTLFTYKNQNYLLTGDLEQEGEEKLSEYYDGSTAEKTLPHCELFKAGHHGSKTSSNECLLSKITPEICTVCCCAGSTEYTANYNNIFPTQEFINRIAKYTDRVYVTSYFDEKELVFKDLNGNICVSSNGNNIGIKCSNNNVKLKDTTWFNETIYVVLKNGNYNICSGLKKKDFYTADTEGAIAVKRRIWPTY